MNADIFTIHSPWSFIHSSEFTTDIIIEEVQETYSTGPPVDETGQQIQTDNSIVTVQYHSYSKETDFINDDDDDDDESDVHDEKFILRFLATNSCNERRYLWVTDEGEVRTDGSYGNLATFFEVIHWFSSSQNIYQLICQGGLCKGYILYMDGSSLKTRKYNPATDDKDITTKFQMTTRGNDNTLRAFISKSGGVPLYFDNEGNFRPEGPQKEESNDSSTQSDCETDTALHPLYFITANVHTLRITSV